VKEGYWLAGDSHWRKKAKIMSKKQAVQCSSCSILIGPRHIETKPYRVGNYVICGWCYGELQTKGRVELDGRRRVHGIGTVCWFLYRDGVVKPMKLDLSHEAQFLPLKEPIPERILSEEDKIEDISPHPA
jgi:hypothetical protein